ncbi:DUF779 domain-containing protein [Brevibacillus sp. SYSU BS000544]|uniref:DUF779 domain-containing protein n=1 Tax=Brevibacillus sp. SYSU BS000544 TaxID=3416443 RepID=UPI003CE4C313
MANEQKLVATDAALKLIERLQEKHGPLLFHVSSGCCDGTTPMCLPVGELLIGESDILLGKVGECQIYSNKTLAEYWTDKEIVLDIASGRSGMFSLEGSERVRFILSFGNR